MTVQDYLRVLRERWVIVLVALLLGAGGGAGAFVARQAEYTATLQTYVSAQAGESPESAFSGAQLSAQRVESYRELARSERVTSEVIGRLGLDVTPQELGTQISATNAEDSVVISLSVTDSSPRRAADIANTVAVALIGLVDELERPDSPGGRPPVVVRVVQPAAVPTGPSSASVTRLVALGILVGLAIGVGAAIVRNAMDTSIKTLDQLRNASDAPNLGRIAHSSGTSKHPLVVHDDPYSAGAEAFRHLRTNVQFVDVGNPHKMLVFTSSLPGEGKTTTLANLAIALAYAGSRVLVIDADLRRPKLAGMFGLDNAVGLTSVLAGRARLDQAIQHWGDGSVDVLASGRLPPNPSELLASSTMQSLLREVQGRYDLILIDSPPLLPVTDAATLAPFTDGAVLVCRYQEVSRMQVETATDALRAVAAKIRGTVLTMAPPPDERSSYYGSRYTSEEPGVKLTPATPTKAVPKPSLRTRHDPANGMNRGSPDPTRSRHGTEQVR